jgi:hypothetical protein
MNAIGSWTNTTKTKTNKQKKLYRTSHPPHSHHHKRLKSYAPPPPTLQLLTSDSVHVNSTHILGCGNVVEDRVYRFLTVVACHCALDICQQLLVACHHLPVIALQQPCIIHFNTYTITSNRLADLLIPMPTLGAFVVWEKWNVLKFLNSLCQFTSYRCQKHLHLQ